jgi:glycerophosphoryl diester phosphodiesterase
MTSKRAVPENAQAKLSSGRPVVIAHRGASGYRPEHTLAAYELAIEMGADFIEPDLVMSKDGAFIARHENVLARIDPGTGAVTEATTNVHEHPQFASRRTTKVIDGEMLTGWFSEDFTLAELKTLRARERIPGERPANVAYNDLYPIPTLQEIIALAKTRSAALGRVVGIYPETKHPSYHASIGLPMERALVDVLAANDWDRADAPVYIQSFEVGNLRYLASVTKVPLIQLLATTGQPWDFQISADARAYADLASAQGLREVASYAAGVGPNKDFVIARDKDGNLAKPTAFVRDAHAAGLLVHPWTFRTENAFLPTEFQRGRVRSERGDGEAEMLAFLRAGVDGFFTDQADLGIAAVQRLGASR